MKDICGNEIKAGDMVHVWWDTPDGPGGKMDYLCTACRTRGRGIKFVTDDGHTLNTEELVERGAQFAIQGSQQKARAEKPAPTDAVQMDELEMISKLRERGWYGTIYKKTLGFSTFRIEMPELMQLNK